MVRSTEIADKVNFALEITNHQLFVMHENDEWSEVPGFMCSYKMNLSLIN